MFPPSNHLGIGFRVSFSHTWLDPYWWASQNRRCSRAQDFSKNAIFGQFLASEASQNKEGEVPPPPPFHIKNFKIYQVKNMAIFGARDASGASFFDGIYDVFCTCLNFYIKTCNFKNYQKITKKSISSWCLAVFGFRPLPQTSSSPGPFLTVFAMFYAHRALFKKEPFLCLRGRVGGTRRLPQKLKLRQRRMPCGPICPASDALCIAGFKTGWRLWPPTRVIILGWGHRARGWGGKEGAASPKVCGSGPLVCRSFVGDLNRVPFFGRKKGNSTVSVSGGFLVCDYWARLDLFWSGLGV